MKPNISRLQRASVFCADEKFSDMPAASAVGDSDYFPIVQSAANMTALMSLLKAYLTSNTAFASSWNGVTNIAPSKNAVYDAIHVFNTADDGSIIDAATGFRIAGGALSGHVLIGDGSNYVASTPTYPNAAPTVGYKLRGDGTNFATYPTGIINSSTGDNTGFASDTYLVGSSIVVASGDFKAGGQYRCLFDMVKTAAGTATMTIDVRIGTLGTTGDTSRMTFTFGAGTAVADTGIFEVLITFRSVGSGTSAVISGFVRAVHNLATTGLFNNGNPWTIIGTTSGGFASNAATTIGLSVNGGASFSGTNKVVQAILNQ